MSVHDQGVVRRGVVACAAMAAMVVVGSAGAQTLRPAGPPRILIDQSPRAVDYQLRRLTNDELATTERKPDDPRYRLVYYALLTRTGLARQYRDEAMAVLVTLDKKSRPRVLIEALGMIAVEDDVASERLVGMLLAEPLERLRSERDEWVRIAEAGEAPGASRRGAYAAWLLVDGTSASAWRSASPFPERVKDLLRAVPSVVADNRAPLVASELRSAIEGLLTGSLDPDVRVAAVTALGAIGRDRAAIDLVARELSADGSDATRAAAVRSLLQIPLDVWSSALAETVGRTLVALVTRTPPARRTDAASVEAIQLGERLAGVLGGERGAALRRDLAALGVRVVRIETVPEQMRFSLRWFVVEAGRRVQIVLFNPDAMPHNVVVGRPGSLEEIGTAAGAMSMPTDPNAKPFVPATPLVLAATPLVWEGQTERLNFTAPKVAGEYIFACTYPGHWARMYGVMLVVEHLEAWEADRTFPSDPMTREVLR